MSNKTSSETTTNSTGRSSAEASKDEMALREHNIELSLKVIVESSADEFNELLRETGPLTSEQVNLIKVVQLCF